MTIKVGINGFGRIGRLALRAACTTAVIIASSPREPTMAPGSDGKISTRCGAGAALGAGGTGAACRAQLASIPCHSCRSFWRWPASKRRTLALWR